MARKLRIFLENTPHLIYQKAIKNLRIFKDKEDIDIFLKYLQELSLKYLVEIHAYSLRKNNFFLLLTPKETTSISKFMQTLGRYYVRFYNTKYNRRGTLWEGRYKLSIVEEKFFFDVMIYIESLKALENSLESTLLGKNKEPVIFHELYKNLGYTPKKRASVYQSLFNSGLTTKKKSFIANAIKTQSLIASNEFIQNLEKKLKQTLLAKKRGRPKKKNFRGKKMYKKLAVLDKEKHKDLKVKPIDNLKFAQGLSFIPVLASEVEKVGKKFPIVFTADDEPSLIALVSLGEQNLAITEDGKWIDSYIPIFLRKYPFALAANNENSEQKLILIDEESEFVSFKEGNPLFDENLEPTPTLSRAIEFLKVYDRDLIITKNVAKNLKESGILEDREISIGEGEEKKVLVKGFQVVNREKLYELSDDILAQWVRKGIIRFIESHLSSLDNIQNLFDLAMKKQNI